MGKGYLLGIMVSRRSRRRNILKLYQQYNNLKLKLCSFTPNDIRWRRRKIIALCKIKGKLRKRKLALPKVIYNRCYIIPNQTLGRLEKLIGKNKCFNYQNRLSKWEIYNILSNTPLNNHLAKTYLYDEIQLFQNPNLLFLKPHYGFQGKGIYRLEKLENGVINISKDTLAPWFICRNNESFKQKLDELINEKNEYLIQEAIPLLLINNRYFDFRVLVQKNHLGVWEVSTIVSRVAHEGYYNTSITESVLTIEGVLKVMFPPMKIKQLYDLLKTLSIDAATAIDGKIKSMAELSVDFGLDVNGALWIIEVNGNPQKNIYQNVPNLDNKALVFKRPLQYARFLARLPK